MSLKKRITACMIVMIFLALICMIGYVSQKNTRGRMGTMRETMSEILGGEDGRKIALTFDDGPHPYYTEQLLKGLRERDVKATFFLMGKNAEAYPEIVREIYEQGHLIGNHTYSHIQLGTGNVESFKQEIVRTNEVIHEITGEDTIYVRPPYGSWDKKLEKELNMFPVLWTIDPKDWCSSDVSAIVRSVCSKAKENEIILMHDQYKSTVTAAFEVIDKLREEGYEFVTVEEILFE